MTRKYEKVAFLKTRNYVAVITGYNYGFFYEFLAVYGTFLLKVYDLQFDLASIALP